MPSFPTPWCLSIAGFDPTLGAGLLADHRVFAHFNMPHAAILSANTVQNTRHLAHVLPVSIEVIEQQYQFLLEDFGKPSVIKCSLLPTVGHIKWLCELCEKLDKTALIIDPIIKSGSGQLLGDFGKHSSTQKLLSMCDLITPNLLEANQLFGDTQAICNLTKNSQLNALLTDADPENSQTITNQLFSKGKVYPFHIKRQPFVYHGSGCKLASYLALGYLQKMDLLSNTQQALKLTERDLKQSHWQGQCQTISN